jgi:hypothetical protein
VTTPPLWRVTRGKDGSSRFGCFDDFDPIDQHGFAGFGFFFAFGVKSIEFSFLPSDKVNPCPAIFGAVFEFNS